MDRPSLNHICINAYSMRISFFYPCFSVLDQSSRKSYILIICMPFSSLHCLVCSPTISSLRKESSTRRNDRFSCSIFSHRAYATPTGCRSARSLCCRQNPLPMSPSAAFLPYSSLDDRRYPHPRAILAYASHCR